MPNVTLSLAGKGPIYDRLTAEIKRLNVDDSVKQLGFVSDENLVALYQSADVFTMPNRTMPDGDTEGFGLVFLEAAASGVPSVGGHAGGATDAIVHGKTGLLVDGNDTGAIAKALIRLLVDNEARSKMAKAAFEFAHRNDWAVKARQFNQVVASLSGKQSEANR